MCAAPRWLGSGAAGSRHPALGRWRRSASGRDALSKASLLLWRGVAWDRPCPAAREVLSALLCGRRGGGLLLESGRHSARRRASRFDIGGSAYAARVAPRGRSPTPSDSHLGPWARRLQGAAAWGALTLRPVHHGAGPFGAVARWPAAAAAHAGARGGARSRPCVRRCAASEPRRCGAAARRKEAMAVPHGQAKSTEGVQAVRAPTHCPREGAFLYTRSGEITTSCRFSHPQCRKKKSGSDP